MNLYPSILTASLEEYEQQVGFAIASQAVEVIQVDVLDGYFVDNVTLSPLDVTQIEYGNLQIDFHLLVEEPIDFVHEIIAVKDYLPIRSIIAQVERMSNQDQFIEEVRNNGWQVGLSLDLHTPVSAIDAGSWRELDIVQLMTIEAGVQGREFNRQALDKATQIRVKEQKEVEIIVDGGVKMEEIELLKEIGIDSAVIGSGLWDPVKVIEEYSQLM